MGTDLSAINSIGEKCIFLFGFFELAIYSFADNPHVANHVLHSYSWTASSHNTIDNSVINIHRK